MKRIDRPSPNHGTRPIGAGVELLILHYTGMPDARSALDRLTDPSANVSAHYTVDEDGTVYVHVPEERRAWHAGVSSWHGRGDVNSRSVGIEIVNPGHEFGYRPFPPAQMETVAELALEIMGRHHLAPLAVLGHSDVAPERKRDPGELFPWSWLAERGVGVWPQPKAGGPAAPDEIATLLTRVGYDATVVASLSAFQRHYRPAKVDGVADDETLALLRGLADWPSA